MRRVYERDRHLFRLCKKPSVSLTEEQKKEIDDFWKPYSFAYKNDPNTQLYFSSISGRFDPTYIGFGLQCYFLNRHWNHITVAFIGNKNLIDLVFPTAKLPKTVIRNMWARYYTADRTLISREKAIEIVMDELKHPDVDELILKPDDGEEGKGIAFLDSSMDESAIGRAFDQMKEKFICQHVVKNHPSHAIAHPESLNTLRIATYFTGTEVRHIGTVYRMGGSGKKVDNWAAGGIACRVDDKGICAPIAVDHHGNQFTVHPASNFKFGGHQLLHYDEALDAAKQLHSTLPQLRYISWDFAINEVGEPILIELNSCGSGELLQMNGIPCYIDKATLKKVLDNVLIKRFYYDRSNWLWDYREFGDHIEIVRYAGTATHVAVPNSLRGKPVTKIEATAFLHRDVEGIDLPSSLKMINFDYFEELPRDCLIAHRQ